ncbi:hypothetical protein KV557_04400 [Kitasatospora aureofaciens]|uniref:hypothetical protein n=1 Tax=Kitasatospora aureofaciens TaxID=1894 RepID=UPI001C4891EA|nr:hypothetical protein [Kitasatospora aureofaciens]MBV6696368.1 hypothetical protein [Kitasatospora aureofaciens]
MRATWMAAALTTALALSPVATASASSAGNGAAAPRTSPVSAAFVPVAAPAAVPAPAIPALPAAPAVPDPGAALGALGDIIKLITGLLSSVTSAVPDLGAVQQLVATLESTLQGLIGQLPTLPVPAPPATAPAPSKLPGTTAPALEEQLASVKAKAQALVDTTAAHPALRPHPTVG